MGAAEHIFLLVMYASYFIDIGRDDALTKLACYFKISEAAIANRITKARKTVEQSKLPDWAREIHFKK